MNLYMIQLGNKIFREGKPMVSMVTIDVFADSEDEAYEIVNETLKHADLFSIEQCDLISEKE